MKVDNNLIFINNKLITNNKISLNKIKKRKSFKISFKLSNCNDYDVIYFRIYKMDKNQKKMIKEFIYNSFNDEFFINKEFVIQKNIGKNILEDNYLELEKGIYIFEIVSNEEILIFKRSLFFEQNIIKNYFKSFILLILFSFLTLLFLPSDFYKNFKNEEVISFNEEIIFSSSYDVGYINLKNNYEFPIILTLYEKAEDKVNKNIIYLKSDFISTNKQLQYDYLNINLKEGEYLSLAEIGYIDELNKYNILLEKEVKIIVGK